LQKSVRRFGNVLYIDSSYVLLQHLAPIQELLIKQQSYFVNKITDIDDKYIPNCDSSLQGYVYDRLQIINIKLCL
jgi:hypothetical protein